MNTIHNIKLAIIAAFLLIGGASCDKELDVAPVMTYDGQANMTIAELNALHTVGSVDSYDSIPAGTVISGIIVSSDQEGNCYKYLTIQDETGGIQIKIDNSALYPKYQIGQRIYVECKDLVIGDYRKNRQLGFWSNGSMAGIATSQEPLYIFRDGLVGNEPTPIVLNSKNEATEDMINRLVILKNCHFADPGEPYSDPDASTSRDIVMSDNSVIVLRTSNYAKFAAQPLPNGTGDIVGILTVYNTTIQLTIRDLNDVRIANTPAVETIDLYSVDFSNDPIANQGWSVLGDNGGWFYYAQGAAFAVQNMGATAIESWLVSPVLSNLGGYDNVTLSMPNELCQVNNGQAHKYYSVDFNGTDVHSATWTEVPANGILPAEVTNNANLRIAFQFNGHSGDFWKIPELKITGVANN
ncbi:MAG: OB-fold nucleic acid binding domain-containing protein [Bacteroidales bacterium]|nr:OB-fold nucleic acid binding domain-containing protein [Bacteroidales bacterium]